MYVLVSLTLHLDELFIVTFAKKEEFAVLCLSPILWGWREWTSMVCPGHWRKVAGRRSSSWNGFEFRHMFVPRWEMHWHVWELSRLGTIWCHSGQKNKHLVGTWQGRSCPAVNDNSNFIIIGSSEQLVDVGQEVAYQVFAWRARVWELFVLWAG